MNDVSQTPETIFGEAIEIASRQDRALFLDRACQGNADLRREVEKLVEDHFRAGSFLESPAADLAAQPPVRPITERPGTVIGPYKLLQQIGEGGMGVVFMAEQTEPVQRTVALKIIKPGMDTRQVIARFEAERQALAMMDHPNIAKVLDAGTTDTGRPYFVMELVKGVPITEYCDEKQLAVRERLELFVAGLPGRAARPSERHHPPRHQAVERAGGRVRRQARAQRSSTSAWPRRRRRRLTERTMFTEFGQLVGTFEYMSPEQAELQPARRRHPQRHLFAGRAALRAVDRRDAVRAKAAARGGVRRSAADHPRGGAAQAEHAAEHSQPTRLPSIAANRQHRAGRRLSKQVRGELDWIVMKCLEKDRNRRYETASGLARRHRALSATTSRSKPARHRQLIACASSLAATRRCWPPGVLLLQHW